MTFKQFLKEAPLPDDWDSAIYSPNVPFAKRIKYAQERAQKAGAGSSRVVFIIPYQGRQTVLKIAKNKKGAAQNEAEAELLSDWYLKGLNITVPLIDYDESSSYPTWLHVEYASKAKPSDFIKQCGGTLNDLLAYAAKVAGRRDWHRGGNPERINEESDLASSMVDLVGNYTQLPMGDFSRVANWGIYNGNLVIVDIGLTQDVFDSHYS